MVAKKIEKQAALRTVVFSETIIVGSISPEGSGAHALITNSAMPRDEEDCEREAAVVLKWLNTHLPARTMEELVRLLGVETVGLQGLQRRIDLLLLADQITPLERFQIAKEMFGLQREMRADDDRSDNGEGDQRVAG